MLCCPIRSFFKGSSRLLGLARRSRKLDLARASLARSEGIPHEEILRESGLR